ncbi:MAG: hypothetical protein ACP5OV_00685 [Acidimicrobiales bacterium]
MKRVVAALAAGALSLSGLALLGASTASADSSTTTTLANPIQGTRNLPVYLNVDTVVGGGGTGILKAPIGCALTNEFYVGQTVVFRMSGVNVGSGGTPLTTANVKSAVVVIPGIATPAPMNYGNHGTVAFWSYGWNTTGYPTLGVVNFQIVVTTKAIPAVTKIVTYRRGAKILRRRIVIKRAVPSAQFTYTQAGLATPSQLTLNAVPAT